MIKPFILTLLLLFPITSFASITQENHIAHYNVFLIPANNVNPLLDRIDKRISAGGLTSLYQQGYLPHITLYLSHYQTSALPIIKSKIQALAKRQAAFPIMINSVEKTKGNWLMLTIQNSPQLQALADEITVNLMPLTEKNITPPTWLNYYPEKRHHFTQYGSPNVFSQFQPHITLLAASSPQKLNFIYRDITNTFVPISSKAIGIGIAKDNTNGQAKQAIATYYFKN